MNGTFSGFEGQYHLDNVTVYGATAADKLSPHSADAVSGGTNLVESRYFFNDNLRADLILNRTKFSEVDVESKTKSTGLGVEYKFDNSPLSVFGKYQEFTAEAADFSTHRYLVGVTFSFGKNTLNSRNKSGASLNPIGLNDTLIGMMGSLR